MDDSTESINFCDTDQLTFVNESSFDEEIEVAAPSVTIPYKRHFLQAMDEHLWADNPKCEREESPEQRP